MANIRDSLSHTKWLCKYHIVFTPKYRRKAIYGQLLFIIKNENLLAAEKGCNSKLYIEESSFI